MQSNQPLQEVARQVFSAAELETYLALDLLPGDNSAAALDYIQEKLKTRMFSEIIAIERAGRKRIETARTEIRLALLDEINKISLDLLKSAQQGFSHLESSSVTYLINTNNPGDEKDFNEFDFQGFPFIKFHGEALAAALRIRENPADDQLKALSSARSRWEIASLDMSIAYATWLGDVSAPKEKQGHQNTQSLHQKGRKRLKQSVVNDTDDFYSSIEIGSTYPYAIPIEIPKQASSDDLRMVSQAFRGIGSTLSIPFELELAGPESTLKQAQDARLMYESAGVGFRILAAWIMAVDVIGVSLRCSICYRHSSAISRCSVHATKKQETREARMGKRVRPHFEQRMLELSKTPEIRRRLLQRLSWSEEADQSMLLAANVARLKEKSRMKAIVLANQIRELVVVMNSDIKRDAGKLFRSILEVVRTIENQPEPVGDRERQFRDLQHLGMGELLSLKGFFKAWCGVGRYSPEINLSMLGFDRDNPVVSGSALASTLVPRALMEQRAWTEALQEFKELNLPTAGDIARLLRIHDDKRQVAKILGIGVSTVYKILSRGRRPRKRNFFAKSQ